MPPNPFMKKLLVGLLLLSLNSIAQISEQWAKSYSASGDYSAKFTCVAKDNLGNFYVGGYVIQPSNNRDYLVAKLNSLGDTLWTKIVNGSDFSGDEVTAIAVDKFSNVYVTGFANGNGTGNDILTIKLTTNGDTVWTKIYNHTSNEDDNAYSIAVDTAGNVFVTGESDNNASSIDNYNYVTIKYSSTGVQQWVRRDGVSGNSRAVKVLTDPAGNSYITGRNYSGGDDNIKTIKYDASGAVVWSKSYDGGSDDRALSMAIDSSFAAVYVTGRSDNGNDDDMITLKYSTTTTSNNPLWVKVYNNVDDDRGVDIAVDAAGNIYVTGETDADASINRNWNFVTIKYASNSVQQWAKTYNSSGTQADIPVGICVDASGNVCVTGESDLDLNPLIDNYRFTTLNYNSLGTLQWTATFAGTSNSTGGAEAIICDASGNFIVVGSTENTNTQKDAIAIKYNAAGSPLWNKSYLGLGDNSDNAYKIVTDAANNSYIAGYAISEETDRNMCSIKFNTNGDTQWVKKYNGTSSISNEVANDLVIDASGNVYVAGFTKNSGQSNDVTVIKYNSNGDSVWINKYNNALINGSDKANSIALDNSGNCYVCGYSETSNNFVVSDDFLLIKYNSSGAQQWAVKYNGTANGEDRAEQLLIGTTGIYISGKSWNGNYNDYTLVKYNFNGVQQWVKSNTLFFGDNNPAQCYLDNSENIIMVGKGTTIGNTDYDYFTVKYDAAGNLLWSKIVNGAANGNDEAKAICGDNAGNYYVTGFSDVDPNSAQINYDYFTIAYNSNGDTLWTRTYNGSGNGNDKATAIAADGAGNIIVTGESENGIAGNSNLNIVTLNYSSLGSLLLYANYNGSGNATDSPNAISLKNGNVFICGETYSGSTTQKDILVLKYDNFNVGIKPTKQKKDESITLYPMPVLTDIQIDLSDFKNRAKNMSFVLVNPLGEEIQSWLLSDAEIQKLSRGQIMSGMYFYKIIEQTNVLASGKIVFW